MKNYIWICVVASSVLLSCGQEKEIESNSQHIKEPIFKLLPSAQSGIRFVNEVREDKFRNIIRYQGYYDGGGVAAGDLNNDGLIDLVFTGNTVSNRIYLNKGELRFEDITKKTGLLTTDIKWSNGVSLIDINNDGWLDIYICQSGLLSLENRRNRLYINNKDLTFTESAARYGLDHPGYSTHAAFFDFDQDGDLDMYLGNYGPTELYQDNDVTLVELQLSDPWNGDKFFERIDDFYQDRTKEVGLTDHKYGFAHAVSVGDLNNDGWDDLYVSNDFFEHDYVYLNNGDKTFTESSEKVLRHMSNFSMGNDIVDYNNDGYADIFVLDMVAEDNYRIKANMGGMQKEVFEQFVDQGFQYQYMFNMLQTNAGNGQFSETAHLAGISNTDWSWAPLVADFDLDGWKDLYVTNGVKRDATNTDAKFFFEDMLRKAAAEGRDELTEQEWADALNAMPSQKLNNYFFHNNGNLTFTDLSDSLGIAEPSFSNGAVYADLDNDGDLELVVNNVNQEAFIFNNTLQEQSPRSYLKIILKGAENNPDGLGATVSLYHQGNLQRQQQYFNRGYRSSMAVPMHFGLGTTEIIDSLIVVWPDGSREKQKGVATNQTLALRQVNASPAVNERPRAPQLFTEVTQRVGLEVFTPQNEYDDYIKEELLPHKMSDMGPFLSVGDINSDGLEDVLVGGNKGYAAKAFIQKPGPVFEELAQPAFRKDREFEDGSAILLDIDADGDLDLYRTSSGNEWEAGHNMYRHRFYMNNGSGVFYSQNDRIPDIRESSTVVKAADFDQDGDLDLFVGGRQFPQKYPYPVSSRLLQNDDGFFSDVTQDHAADFIALGMVSDAVWTDYDADSDLDLMVVGEWMPVCIFENENGKLTRRINVPGLEKSHGWWYSLQAHDVDGDGDQDFLAGNLGLNYKYKATAKEPFQVYSKDFDGNGSNDIVLAYFNNHTVYPLRGRSCSSSQIPSLKQKFPTYESFAQATLEDVYGEADLADALHLQAYQFATSYIENLGQGRFQVHELPNYLQMSSVNGIVTMDINGDQQEDYIMAGNMYGSEIETVRNDAGFGAAFGYDVEGGFEVWPYAQTGIFIPGNVKDLTSIHTGSQPLIIASRSHGNLQVFQLNPPASGKMMALKP